MTQDPSRARMFWGEDVAGVVLIYEDRSYLVEHHGSLYVVGPMDPTDDTTVLIELDFPDYGRLEVRLPVPAARQLSQQLMVACGDVP